MGCSAPSSYFQWSICKHGSSKVAGPHEGHEGQQEGGQAHGQGCDCRGNRRGHALKKSVCAKIMNSLAALASSEVKKTGKFVIPGVTRLQTRVKPATKAGKREMFGKEGMGKAKPAKTIVKAYPVGAIKKS